MSPPNDDPRMKFAASPSQSPRNKERQPYSSFKALNVAPNAPTNLKLSGGRTIPYIYSLGVNSTVPYIRLVGGSTSQKLFSWNEQIVVPPGELVTVSNGSYHPGDIFLQSGADPAAIPARVTVPVPMVVGAGLVITPAFVLDVRRARRAFVGGFNANAANLTMFIFGEARERSHGINPVTSDLGLPTATYTDSYTIPASTAPGLIPLGDNAQPGDAVHDLLDVASFQYGAPDQTNSGALHYILEYL